MSIRNKLKVLAFLVLGFLTIILFNGYLELRRSRNQIENVRQYWNSLERTQNFALEYHRFFGDFLANLLTDDTSTNLDERLEELRNSFENRLDLLDQNPTELLLRPERLKEKFSEFSNIIRTLNQLRVDGYRESALQSFGDAYNHYQQSDQMLDDRLVRLREKLQMTINQSLEQNVLLPDFMGWYATQTETSRLLLQDWILAKKVNTVLARQWVDILSYIATEKSRFKRQFVARGFELKQVFIRWKNLREKRNSTVPSSASIDEAEIDKVYQDLLDQSLRTIQELEEDDFSTVRSIIAQELNPTIQELRAKTDQLNVNKNIQSIEHITRRVIYLHLLLTSGISLLLSSIIILLIYRSGQNFLGTINKLIDYAEEIGGGEFGKRLSVDTGDELEVLTGYMNEMAKELQDSTISRTYLENIFNSMSEMLFVMDRDYRIKEVNEALCERLGRNRNELLGTHVRTIFDGDTREENLSIISNIDQGKLKQTEVQFKTRDGETFPVQLTGSILDQDVDGNPDYVCVGMDISNLKRALDEKEMLLKEVHHRVKNNLQIILSMIRLQSRRIDDESLRQNLKASRRRIHSMALIHEKLYEGTDISNLDFEDYVQELCQIILEGYGTEFDELVIDVEVQVQPNDLNIVIPCGLIINELVTNSLKYAFEEGTDNPRIRIEFYRTDSNYHLEVRDNGKGIGETDWENSESLGMTLVRSLAEGQLRGELQVFSENGTTIQVIIPEDIDT